MPSSKSKKHSTKTASSPLSSLSSSSKPYVDSEIVNEEEEQELLRALEEASRKFPSLISITAFIGNVYNDASCSSIVAEAALDSKGSKIWMSESAMIASSIPPGSLVSVNTLFFFFLINLGRSRS